LPIIFNRELQAYFLDKKIEKEQESRKHRY
jgi:hypothetical protein